MYTLFYSPGACSMAVHVVLNELGVPFKLEASPRDAAGQRSEALRKVNPRGVVPVLVDGDIVVREGGAILSYLLDKHESPMLPRSGKERAAALEWLMFANATMHPAYSRAFFLKKNVTDKVVSDQLLGLVREQITNYWKEVDDKLASQPYVAGKDITAADILLTVIANWQSMMPFEVPLGANVKKLLKSVSSRPSYQKALTTEQVEYKAAA